MRDLILLTSMQLTFSNNRLMTMPVHNIQFLCKAISGTRPIDDMIIKLLHNLILYTTVLNDFMFY
jgi:hypothetical protein